LPHLQITIGQTDTTIPRWQARISGNGTPYALLSKQMGESRPHNQFSREIRFCNCRQVLPIKPSLWSLERPKLGMASGIGSRAASSEPRHCSWRYGALVHRCILEWARCSHERQDDAV